VKDSDGTDNYTIEATQTHAAGLKGRLFLIHGGMDNNVPPYNTYLVADALIKANKEFDMLILPNAGHGFGQAGNYIMVQRWNYFVRHLLDAEPPRDYVIPAAPASGGRRGGGPHSPGAVRNRR
jgi:dienelactone hydrolase